MTGLSQKVRDERLAVAAAIEKIRAHIPLGQGLPTDDERGG